MLTPGNEGIRETFIYLFFFFTVVMVQFLTADGLIYLMASGIVVCTGKSSVAGKTELAGQTTLSLAEHWRVLQKISSCCQQVNNTVF